MYVHNLSILQHAYVHDLLHYQLMYTFKKLGFLKLQTSIPLDPYFLCHIHLWPIIATNLSLPKLYHPNQKQIYTIQQLMHVPHAYTITQHIYPSTIPEQNHSTNQPTSIISKHHKNHPKNASIIHHAMNKSKHKYNI